MFLIIALGWLYVAFMMSLGATSLFTGLVGFIAWGPVPVGILWYIFGRRKKEANEDQPSD